MPTANIGNPVGYVPIFDGGNPRILTGIAGASTVSGGVFVTYSGTTNIVSSGADSYTNTDIKLIESVDASGCLGISLQTIGSNEPLAAATRVMAILVSAGTVIGGQPVTKTADNAVVPLAGSVSPVNYPIGRAVTSAGSEGYCIVDFGRL